MESITVRLRPISAKRVIAGMTIATLGACRDLPETLTAPEISSPRQSLMCVRQSADGGAPEVVAPNAQGGCPAGFDIKVWY